MEWVVVPLFKALKLLPLALLILALTTPLSAFLLGAMYAVSSCFNFIITGVVFGLSAAFTEEPVFGSSETVEQALFPFVFTALYLGFTTRLMHELSLKPKGRAAYAAFTIVICTIITTLVPANSDGTTVVEFIVGSYAIVVWFAVHLYLVEVKKKEAVRQLRP